MNIEYLKSSRPDVKPIPVFLVAHGCMIANGHKNPVQRKTPDVSAKTETEKFVKNILDNPNKIMQFFETDRVLFTLAEVVSYYNYLYGMDLKGGAFLARYGAKDYFACGGQIVNLKLAKEIHLRSILFCAKHHEHWTRASIEQVKEYLKHYKKQGAK